MPKKRRTDTPETFYSFMAKHATDADLLEQLADARTCAELIPQPDPTRLEAGIAELECEVARRGLEVPDPIPEPMLPRVALHGFLRGINFGDVDRIDRTLPWLDAGGLWQAFRAARQAADARLRTACLERLLLLLDCRVFSSEFAASRRNAIMSLGLDGADYDALIEQCFVNLFTLMLLYEDAN